MRVWERERELVVYIVLNSNIGRCFDVGQLQGQCVLWFLLVFIREIAF